MTDLSEKMDRFETVREKAGQARRRRDALGAEIGTELADHVEVAIEDAGTSVETAEYSASDERFRFEAHLDRAEMLATLTDRLPAGFVVAGIHDDGTLTIEWTGGGREATKRNRDIILKALIDEGVETDTDGLITSVPAREDVLARADTLGIDRETATERLDRLVRLDMVDIEDGAVYPSTNF